ncbi:MAG: DinB family protein [Bryobacteraceae bacterium]
MDPQELISELKASREFFERSTRCLTEPDSGFRPAEGTYSAAQQVSHAARTIDWFVEGASRPQGFDMDFERHLAEAMAVTSLTAAREWLTKSYDSALEFFGSKTEAELDRPLPPGPVMGGAPVRTVVSAIAEHTAHHRGALTVYSRLLGKTPLMPYFE